MADVKVSAQLQQWSFEKPSAVRPERSDSSASSPNLSHTESDTLRIDAAAVQAAQNMSPEEAPSFQERYLSSEEDLSPMDGNSSDSDDYDSDVSIHEAEKSYFKARTMSISRWDKGRSCDMAVAVSYVSAGRPKMIDLAGSPIRETPQRSASLAQLPVAAIQKLRQQDQHARHSLMVAPSSITSTRSPSPAISVDTRMPSTSSSPFIHGNNSAVLLSDSGSSMQTGSSRSSSPSVNEPATTSKRPVSAAPLLSQPPRSSMYIGSTARSNPLAPFPPLTPQSPATHAFLSSDPFESSNTNAASPIIKSAPHKRLRSISQKLSLAKIAITPSAKKWDSRVNGRTTTTMPPTPATPYTPVTPQTAPILSTSSPMNKLRRNSRILSRPATSRGSTPDIPAVPSLPAASSPRKPPSKRMVARGADEREPTIELPPCPDQEDHGSVTGSIKSRRLRKRKSLLDLL